MLNGLIVTKEPIIVPFHSWLYCQASFLCHMRSVHGADCVLLCHLHYGRPCGIYEQLSSEASGVDADKDHNLHHTHLAQSRKILCVIMSPTIC